MALKYNGTSPTAIKYNGTDLTVLKYGSTTVWGKPYSLTVNKGDHVTLSITRTSSPNQHAATGTLSNGSVIYHGDVLYITYYIDNEYAVDKHTINGSTFEDGTSYTVTGATTIEISAVSTASWHTVWSGSKRINTPSGTDITTFTASGFTGMQTGYKTRITGHTDWYEENYSWSMNRVYFTLQLGYYLYQHTLDTTGDSSDLLVGEGYSSSKYPYCFVGPYSISTTSIGFRTRPEVYTGLYYYMFGTGNMYITKIEQYY